MASYTISSKGVCVPNNDITLFVFKNVQKEANRFLDAQKKPLLTCDGKLGSKTLAAINSVKSMFPTSGVLGADIPSCSKVADNAAAYYNDLSNVANQNKLMVVPCPTGIIRSITNPQPKVEPGGAVVYPSVATSGLGGVPYWLIALIGGGSYYYFYQTKSGKKQLKSFRGGF